MYMKIKYLLILSFISLVVYAGEVHIETKGSLIRNDVFDAKRDRIEAYRDAEALRQLDNELPGIDISATCLLLKTGRDIYFCVRNRRYYQQFIEDNEKHYRVLSILERQQQLQ